MSHSYRQAIHQAKFIFIIILFLLSGCNQAVLSLDTSPTHSQTQSPTQVPATATSEPTPTVTNTATPSPSPTPTPQPEIDPQEFDYTMLDVMQWEGKLRVSDIEKHEPGYMVQVREGFKTVMYELPLFEISEEAEESYFSGLRMLDIPEGTKFELLETRKIRGENGQNITVGIMRNHSSTSIATGMGLVILSAETEDGKIINFTESSTDDISVTSFFLENGRQDQLALSLFLKNLLEYQIENGPFKAGEEYSLVEITKIISTDEFRRLLFHPERNNISLDTVVSSLAHTLVNKNHVAFRIPETITNENVNFTGGYDSVFSDKYTIGVKINGGSAPENDMVLTFQEGENGETEYYITGDMTGMRRGDILPIGFISFYLSSEISQGELEENLRRMEEVYEKHLGWEKGEEEPLTESATGYKYYLFESDLGPERLRHVFKVIYTPMERSDFFK